jgi:hypothetical protein
MAGAALDFPLWMLVFPVVAGYGFSVIWKGTLFKASREDKGRLHFRAVFYGICVTVWTVELHIIAYAWCESYVNILTSFANIAGITDARTMFGGVFPVVLLSLTVIVGPVFGHILNSPAYFRDIYGRSGYSFALLDAVADKCLRLERIFLKEAIKNNDIELLLLMSVEKPIPLMFTLSTGKVYVGWVARPPKPVEERKAIRILVMISGYRSPEDHKVALNTYYEKVLAAIVHREDPAWFTEADLPPNLSEFDHLDVDDFEVVFSFAELVSCHPYDDNVHMLLGPQEDEESDGETRAPASGGPTISLPTHQ